MKLAEALLERGDLQKRVEQLRHRITSNARYQEGEAPAEDPAALLAEVGSVLAALEKLVVAINLTNSATVLSTGGTMTEALAHRDALRTRHAIVTAAADAASGQNSYRQLRSELRELSALPIAELRAEGDELARSLRELDIVIQSTNWEADLQS
jgi:N-acetylglucosamine kinase-like BadF-type ATPase